MLNITHDITISSSRLVVCNIVVDEFIGTPISGCKSRKAEWHTTRLLLKDMCPQATISYGENGEPILNNSKEYSHISISHGAGMVAILLSQDLCGVDIESTTRNFSRIATRFLNERERNIISPEYYPMAWSAKEAIFKYFRGKEVEFLTDFDITSIDDDKIKIDHKGMLYTLFMINTTNYTISYITN